MNAGVMAPTLNKTSTVKARLSKKLVISTPNALTKHIEVKALQNICIKQKLLKHETHYLLQHLNFFVSNKHVHNLIEFVLGRKTGTQLNNVVSNQTKRYSYNWNPRSDEYRHNCINPVALSQSLQQKWTKICDIKTHILHQLNKRSLPDHPELAQNPHMLKPTTKKINLSKRKT